MYVPMVVVGEGGMDCKSIVLALNFKTLKKQQDSLLVRLQLHQCLL